MCPLLIIMEFIASCSDGEVRLVEGESEWEGRLEVCFSRRWGTVGSDGWTQTNAQVVCNDLGYESDSGIVCGYYLAMPVYASFKHNIYIIFSLMYNQVF